MMRVCYFGTYRKNYSRNAIMIEGLRRNGVDVTECHVSLWTGIEDRVEVASGGWKNPKFWWRIFRAYGQLLAKFRRTGPFDVLVVGYPGQFDVFLARILSWLRRKPLVWDIFMSIYLIAIERDLDSRSAVTLRLIRYAESTALRLPDLLIQDTQDYVSWFQKTYGINPNRFRLVPTGADDREYKPVVNPVSTGTSFTVTYYGSFIPNHGVPYIVEAARLLSEEQDILFELIGQGPERERSQQLAKQYGLRNINFVEWLSKPELVDRIGRSDLCLGAFGHTPQSLMTVQNKIYEGLGMAKPVITGDSSAVRQVFEHGTHIHLVERGDPQTLANAVLELKNNPAYRQSLALNGHDLFRQHFTVERLGQQFRRHLFELVDSRRQVLIKS